MKRYRIIITALNTWHMDGTPIVEREHGTTHRSLKAAHRQHKKLLGYNSKTHTRAAAWHRSFISEVYPDGSYRFGLDAADREALDRITYEHEAGAAR